LVARCLHSRVELQEARERCVTLEPAAVTTMVVRERKAPRETHIMLGGDFTRPGAKVTPGLPAVLRPNRLAASRLDLARWLVDPGNPLTARVQVNRYWGQFFGTGI